MLEDRCSLVSPVDLISKSPRSKAEGTLFLERAPPSSLLVRPGRRTFQRIPSHRHFKSIPRVRVPRSAHSSDGVHRVSVDVQTIIQEVIPNSEVDDLPKHNVPSGGLAGIGSDNLQR